MAILLTDTLSVPPPRATDPAAQLHQSCSSRLGWWGWLDRPFQRIALRDIADNPHLLRDLGLTREEALREAAKPFWR